MVLGAGITAFGITMERIPFFKLAFTFSCSMRRGNLKLRLKDPERRSETQYFGCSTSGDVSGIDVSGSAMMVSSTFSVRLAMGSVSDSESPGLLINSPSSSSSTEGAW